ncbi:cation:proton antiporter [Neoroseomonas rubea]|uniref:cation:proton antiporter n=1 Tax=Neoroseomonas rubea TaxID=2748666 RepID=UPI0018E00488|nr:cation:proton antiporter [Roseomonas rubea]
MNAKVGLLCVAAALVAGPWLLWRIGAVRAVAPLAVLQILGGVALGPSLFGRLAPEAHAAVFTAPVLSSLQGLAAVGVLLYVFVSGLHLDPARLKGEARGLKRITAGSFLLPFLLGLGVGAWIAAFVPGAIGPRGDAVTFTLAIGVCIAVTALPILAAILREAGWIGTRLGQTALALAAVNDAALWLVLAALLAIAAGAAAQIGTTLLFSLLWGAALLGCARLLRSLAEGEGAEARMLVLGVALCFVSAAAAEAIGLGYILGGFAAGVVMPPASRAALIARIEPLTATVLLPFFFVSTGLKATIDPGSAAFLSVLLLATVATFAGKVAGTALPARQAGESWSFALALGVLMQTKGLMEVVVLAALLDAGMIGPVVFSGLIAMAVVTTVIAAPLARLALGQRGDIRTRGTPRAG